MTQKRTLIKKVLGEPEELGAALLFVGMLAMGYEFLAIFTGIGPVWIGWTVWGILIAISGFLIGVYTILEYISTENTER